MLEIRLMGEVSILGDGEPLDLPQSRKTLAPLTTIESVRMTLPIKDEAAMERYLGALRLAGLPDA